MVATLEITHKNIHVNIYEHMSSNNLELELEKIYSHGYCDKPMH